MRIVKKGEDTFVEFEDFDEVRDAFNEAIKDLENEKKLTPVNPLMRPDLPNEDYTIFESAL
ncbi:hypothetical protein IC006_2196 [Sulfuracidifex tepidarius]|uniref:Uncharacterized protein n=1 Tax=Sulfuracidifex tepidarius TaxID=1294262 RepID=A0A510E5C6_9CREN|nr:hypothetical protein IC006_2196 [Sulfuracidifex tepidarius]BBG27647.1 hypothetical protein IC007_2201 [Sulfuracidifex tepidarius]